MNVMKLFANRQKDPYENKIPTIAFLGDSVTHGCFDLQIDDKFRYVARLDRNNAYPAYLYRMLSVLYPTVPVNIINSGFDGSETAGAIKRMNTDVLPHNPDLTIVCLGLNDSYYGDSRLDVYYNNLKTIFTTLKEASSEVIFMTPNMLNTRIVPPKQPTEAKNNMMLEAEEEAMNRQNSGVFDRYIDAARKAAAECDVTLCDVYAKWKTMAANGVDTTALLSNDINHPTEQLHWLFAWSLIETMFS